VNFPLTVLSLGKAVFYLHKIEWVISTTRPAIAIQVNGTIFPKTVNILNFIHNLLYKRVIYKWSYISSRPNSKVEAKLPVEVNNEKRQRQ
jgi:hypothetical protein